MMKMAVTQLKISDQQLVVYLLYSRDIERIRKQLLQMPENNNLAIY